jgi:hypothetical protein
LPTFAALFSFLARRRAVAAWFVAGVPIATAARAAMGALPAFTRSLSIHGRRIGQCGSAQA